MSALHDLGTGIDDGFADFADRTCGESPLLNSLIRSIGGGFGACIKGVGLVSDTAGQAVSAVGGAAKSGIGLGKDVFAGRGSKSPVEGHSQAIEIAAPSAPSQSQQMASCLAAAGIMPGGTLALGNCDVSEHEIGGFAPQPPVVAMARQRTEGMSMNLHG